MDVRAAITPTAVNSVSSGSSSSSASSGYGSATTTPTTPVGSGSSTSGSQYDAHATTPVGAVEPTPVATIAPVTPYYNEAITASETQRQQQQQQQQQQQHYQPYGSYASQALPMQYNTYDPYASSYQHYGLQANIEQRRYAAAGAVASEKLTKTAPQQAAAATGSSASNVYRQHTEAAITTKPQATATPFYTQPLHSTSSTATAAGYYDPYKYKMPSKLPNLPADYHASYAGHLSNPVTYHTQPQFYTSGTKTLQDISYSKPLSVSGARAAHSNAYYGSGNTAAAPNTAAAAYYDKYEKYMYTPPAAMSNSTLAHGASTLNPPAYPAPPSHYAAPPADSTNDAYRKASSAWHWSMEYAGGNCRTLPPPPGGGGGGIPTATVPPTNAAAYLPPHTATAAAQQREATLYAHESKYAKYDKYNAAYYHQQYLQPATRNAWPTHQLTPMSAERMSHTHAPPHHHFPPSTTASSMAVNAARQSCCNQPYAHHPQQHPQSCYYAPRAAPQLMAGAYAAPQVTHLQQPHYAAAAPSGNSAANAKYSSLPEYSHANKLKNSNDLYYDAHMSYNYAAPANHAHHRYAGASMQQSLNPTVDTNAYYNDLNLQTLHDSYPSNMQHGSLNQYHQPQQVQQQPQRVSQPLHCKSTLLDYRKQPTQPAPIAAPTDCYITQPRLDERQYELTANSFTTYDLADNITAAALYSANSDGISDADKAGSAAKVLSIRDFLTTWNEEEEEEFAANNSDLNFMHNESQLPAPSGLVVTQNERLTSGAVYSQEATLATYKPAMPTATAPPATQQTPAENQLQFKGAFGPRPKIHVGITVDGTVNVETNQYINLPDIVIDIEKSNNTGAPPAVAASATATPMTDSEKVTPFGNFDVEKELDELQIKKAKLSVEKQSSCDTKTTAEITIADSAACQPIADKQSVVVADNAEPRGEVNNSFEGMLSQTKTGVEISVEKSQVNAEKDELNSENNSANSVTVPAEPSPESSAFDNPEQFLKDIEYDSNSHSNGSTFEKEYETFINKIGSDSDDNKVLAAREDANEMLVQDLSMSKTSSSLNSPTTSRVLSPVASAVTSSETSRQPSRLPSPVPSDLTSPVLSRLPSPVTSPVLSHPPSPVRSNLMSPEPSHLPTPSPSHMTSPVLSPLPSPALSRLPSPVPSRLPSPVPSRSSSPEPSHLQSPVPSPKSPINDILPVGASHKVILENKTSNSEDIKRNSESDYEFTQKIKKFSKFYKKKRKISENITDEPQIPTKSKKVTLDKIDPTQTAKTQNFPIVYTKKFRKRKEITKRLRLKYQRKREMLGAHVKQQQQLAHYYKTLRTLRRFRFGKLKPDTTALVQQHIAMLKERHLPLIKRQSIKKYATPNSHMNFNPKTLKCLSISTVNTDEFRKCLLTEVPEEQAEPISDEPMEDNIAENLKISNSETAVGEAVLKPTVLESQTAVLQETEINEDERKDEVIEDLELSSRESLVNEVVEEDKLVPLLEDTEIASEILETEEPPNKQETEEPSEITETEEPSKITETEEPSEITGTDKLSEILETEEHVMQSRVDDVAASSELDSEDALELDIHKTSPINQIENDTVSSKNAQPEHDIVPNVPSFSDESAASEMFAILEQSVHAEIPRISSPTTIEEILDDKDDNNAEEVKNNAEPEAISALQCMPEMDDKIEAAQEDKTNELVDDFKPHNDEAIVAETTIETAIERIKETSNAPQYNNEVLPIMHISKDNVEEAEQIVNADIVQIKETETNVASAEAEIQEETAIPKDNTISKNLDIHDESSCSSTTSSSSITSNNSTISNAYSTNSADYNDTSSSCSSSSSSSSSDSSSTTSEKSDFNELEELEKELSQHNSLHENVFNAGVMMEEGIESELNTHCDEYKSIEYDEETRNSDIAKLKRILESDNEEHDDKNNSDGGDNGNVAAGQCEGVETKAVLYPEEAEELPQAVEVLSIAANSVTADEMRANGNSTVNNNMVPTLKSLVAAHLEKYHEVLVDPDQFNANIIENHENINNINTIPKLSDLCKNALNSSFETSELTVAENINYLTIATSAQEHAAGEGEQRELSVEEAFAEMYRQAGVFSDPEDYESNEDREAQDVLLINLEEILVSDSDLYVVQCDMNDNVLSVLAHSDGSHSDGQSADDNDHNSSEALNSLQLVEILNANDFENSANDNVIVLQAGDVTAMEYMQPAIEAGPEQLEPAATITQAPDMIEQHRSEFNENDNSASQFDFPTIHHEEIVPENYVNFEKQKFLKYLHAKYVQKNVSKFYRSNRVLKKYKRHLTKKILNRLKADKL